MSQQPRGVLIAIDWENIRRGAQLYGRNVRPAELCRAMSDVGRIFGEVVGGKAFGDWSLRPDDGREFTEHDIVLYHASRTSAGKDRSDPAILLEVYEWIRDREDCGTVILGSGDADYQVLVDRARLHGRRIVLCAFSRSVSRDMLATAPFFPLEAELGIQLAEHGDVNVSLSAVSEVDDPGTDDALERFVREMHRLEGRLNFVGYTMLCNQWMLDLGDGVERERVSPADRRVPGVWDRGTPRGDQPEQPRLAHVGGPADPHQRDSAPGAGVQRRARIKPGPGALTPPRAAWVIVNSRQRWPIRRRPASATE